MKSLIIDKVICRRGVFELALSVKFQAGKLTVVLGPSGCGKSTLLELAAGFIKPNSGKILEGDKDVSGIKPNKRNVGFVFQDYALFPHLKVKDNIAYGPKVRGWNRNKIQESVNKCLDITKLNNLKNRYTQSLSGGERQRVALARAMAIEPDFLLLDEPFSSLDAALTISLRMELKNIQKQTGITSIMVTHNQREAMGIADQLVIMHSGKLIQNGHTAEVWKNPKNLFAAQILGRAGFLNINSLHCSGNSTTISTSIGSWNIKNNNEISQLPAALIIRPEDVTIQNNQGIKTTVVSSEFIEGFWQVKLKPDGSDTDIIEIDLPAASKPRKNDVLLVDINKDNAKIIALNI